MLKSVVKNYNKPQHGCARVAHCITVRWRNFSHYCRPLRHYDVWFTCSDNRDVLTAAPTAHGIHKQAFRARHWTSREASLRHSSGWGLKRFPSVAWFARPWFTVIPAWTIIHYKSFPLIQRTLVRSPVGSVFWLRFFLNCKTNVRKFRPYSAPDILRP